MKMMIALILLAIYPVGAVAEDIFLVGTGGKTCAVWLQSKDKEGLDWMFGFWTGRNWSEGSLVGQSIDAAGIEGEVRKACQEDPSRTLVWAAELVFLRLKGEHR